MKCLKCGSTNVKVDFSSICTYFSGEYKCECQDCGHTGFINCNEVDTEEFNSEGYRTNDTINTPKEEPKGGLMGWICPKCGRCYSPFTSMCPYCCNDVNTILCYDGTFETNLDGTVKY